jgi:hypothetical protein
MFIDSSRHPAGSSLLPMNPVDQSAKSIYLDN